VESFEFSKTLFHTGLSQIVGETNQLFFLFRIMIAANRRALGDCSASPGLTAVRSAGDLRETVGR
jgi:hypothetical protein